VLSVVQVHHRIIAELHANGESPRQTWREIWPERSKGWQTKTVARCSTRHSRMFGPS
jgi:hypothetical protein